MLRFCNELTKFEHNVRKYSGAQNFSDQITFLTKNCSTDHTLFIENLFVNHILKGLYSTVPRCLVNSWHFRMIIRWIIETSSILLVYFTDILNITSFFIYSAYPAAMANTIKYPTILAIVTAADPIVMHVQHILSQVFFAHLLHFFPFLYVPTVDSVPEPSGMYPHELFWVFGAHLILKFWVGTGLVEN